MEKEKENTKINGEIRGNVSLEEINSKFRIYEKQNNINELKSSIKKFFSIYFSLILALNVKISINFITNSMEKINMINCFKLTKLK